MAAVAAKPAMSSGMQMLYYVMADCRKESPWPRVSIPAKKLLDIMVAAGLGIRMTRRYCEILGVTSDEEDAQIDYRRFLLGMLFFLGRSGGERPPGGAFFDVNRSKNMRKEFIKFVHVVYTGEGGEGVVMGDAEALKGHLAALMGDEGAASNDTPPAGGSDAGILSLDNFTNMLGDVIVSTAKSFRVKYQRDVTWQANMPYVKVNGETLFDAEFEQCSDGGKEMWTYRTKDSFTLTHLEVGLRDSLAKRAADEGGSATVVVSLQGGGGIEEGEKAELALSNNFRCCWPDLKLHPLKIGGSVEAAACLTVTVKLNLVCEGVRGGGGVGSPSRTAMAAQVSNNNIVIGTGDTVGGDGVGSKRKRGVDGADGGHDGGEAGGIVEAVDSDRDESVVSGLLMLNRLETETQQQMQAECQYSPSDAEQATVGQDDDPADPPTAPPSGIGGPLPNASLLGRLGSPWQLASHTVQLNRHQGTVDRFDELWGGGAVRRPGGLTGGVLSDEMNQAEEDCGATTPRSSGSPWTPRSPCPPPRSLADDSSGAGGGNVSSSAQVPQSEGHCPAFDMASTPNQLLEALKYFEMPLPPSKGKETGKAAFSWGEQPESLMTSLAGYIGAVAAQVRLIALHEPRCLHLQSPTYILGDLHGNYQDLVAFEKGLWRIGMGISPASFLFLGDYVDRGKFSVEVAVYLLAQKALFPRKVALLRGNHETRVQNGYPGYSPCLLQSCTQLFGDTVGAKVWEDINSVFDVMPLAAIIDKSIFCAHGGIPERSLLSPVKTQAQLAADIGSVPAYLPHPDPAAEGGNALAWDLMWNDPAPIQNKLKKEKDGETGAGGGGEEQRGQVEREEMATSSGFGPNLARGTAHVFTAEGLELFLNDYGLTHLVRAHEVRQTGFQVQQHSRMVTLFSSSGYCGSTNDASCILASQGKLRFIRLEHSLRPGAASLATKAAAASSLAAHVHELSQLTATQQSPVPSLSAVPGSSRALHIRGAPGGDDRDTSPRRRLQLAMQKRLHQKAFEADVKAASILSGVEGIQQDWGETEDDDSMAAALAQAAVAQVDGAVDGGRSTSHERTEAHREGGDNGASSAGSGSHASPVDLNEEKASLLNLMASKGLPIRTRAGTKPIC